MKSLHSILINKKCLYIADHIKNGNVLKIADSYFKACNYVPGFADAVCVTSKKHLTKIRRLYKDGEFGFSLVTCIPEDMPYQKPDLVCIDDINLLNKDIRKVYLKYASLPLIYTGHGINAKSMSVIVDTREQLPLMKDLKCKRMKLEVGDYTTEKLLNKFHIERKTLQDLYGTIIQGHVRFRNELIRAEVNSTKLAMYVEGSKKKFINLKFPGGSQRNIKPETLEKIIGTITDKYGLETVWCSNRQDSKNKVLKRLKYEEQKLNR